MQIKSVKFFEGFIINDVQNLGMDLRLCDIPYNKKLYIGRDFMMDVICGYPLRYKSVCKYSLLFHV